MDVRASKHVNNRSHQSATKITHGTITVVSADNDQMRLPTFTALGSAANYCMLPNYSCGASLALTQPCSVRLPHYQSNANKGTPSTTYTYRLPPCMLYTTCMHVTRIMIVKKTNPHRSRKVRRGLVANWLT